jgi:hypothetical protein
MSPWSFAQLVARDGVDSHLANPRGQHLANLSIIFACLSFTFVSFRLWTRYFINKSVGIDDYLIIPATVETQSYKGIGAPWLRILGFGYYNGPLLQHGGQKWIRLPQDCKCWWHFRKELYTKVRGLTASTASE